MESLIIRGEKIQDLADVFIGHTSDFAFNPFIRAISNKHMNIFSIPNYYNNPRIIFCYSNRIKEFSEKINCFKNRFILITHNSDENIVETHNILLSTKLIHWYTQNLCIQHDKISPIPIGIANNMWKNGIDVYRQNFNNLSGIHLLKTGDICMNFNLHTNFNKRNECYEILKNNIPFLQSIDMDSHLRRLSAYKYCICPEGNGVDTHRLWEALYMQSIPIVLNSDFIQIIKKHINPPLIILESWSDICDAEYILPEYSSYIFNDDYSKKFSFDYYKELINSHFV
jgi:hypothetical protein